MFPYDLLWTQGVDRGLSCVCVFCMRVVVPTASMQEINLPLTQEACGERQTGRQGELDDSEQSSHRTGGQAQRQME